jgi:hypothetical protein
MGTKVTEFICAETRAFVRKRHGSAKWDEIYGKLGDKTKKHYFSEPDPSNWVDFDVVHDLLRTVKDALEKDDKDIMHNLGMHNAEYNLGFTQKILMKILTIKMVLKIASFLWTGRVKDGGTMVVSNTGKTSVRCRIELPPDSSEYWWAYLAGWFQRTIEIAGGKGVKSRWVGGGKHDGDTAEYEVSWN